MIIRCLFAGEMDVQRDKYWNKLMSDDYDLCMNIQADDTKNNPILQCKFSYVFIRSAVRFNQ
ncbi:hypothetical protein [Bacteroides uniformis]|uniref:hypothetical protein n=1 Tax=Bacteroides uniformis TaxID=820 RepID=UPI00233F6F3D|nr:hypothetical protein [Bacteroides uniformis]